MPAVDTPLPGGGAEADVAGAGSVNGTSPDQPTAEAVAKRHDVAAEPDVRGTDATVVAGTTDAGTKADTGGGGEEEKKDIGQIGQIGPIGQMEDSGRPPPEGPPELPPERSITRLTVVPADTLVYVDGKMEGNQPQRIACVAGEKPRHIRLEREGYLTQEFDLSHPGPRILGKSLQRVETGRFRLRYFPASAEVIVDGIPRTPEQGLNIIELTLPIGPHKVVVKAGDKTTTRDITLAKDKEWTDTITAGQ